MQDYNTIIGVIQMRQNNCSYRVIRDRYHLGTSTVTLILKRFETTQKTLEELKQMDPSDVEALIFPPVWIFQLIGAAVPDERCTD